ncbi:copper-binding protein [Pseudomonas izuensis]|uniref:Copper-binding protein n=1 Tax=Pseudomonas izuensis TaxID=2684212 RepID=A0ABM7RTN5_9PSED|nr:copper-binding protein [Pseudomonas izuensis]BCX68653.1 copper-binding protein [Pseudomonas izuensis]
MKLTRFAVTGTLLALSFFARAEEMPGMNMGADAMEGTPMKQPAASTPVASASGTIKAIDSARHKVTIAHGAVPALQWPPMTMGFQATEAQLATVKVGDQVNFKFQQEGAAATIVSIDVEK